MRELDAAPQLDRTAEPDSETPAFAVVVIEPPLSPVALPVIVTCGRLRSPEMANVEVAVLTPSRKFVMVTVI